MGMRVLGIDPGSVFMGLGCVEKRGSQLLWIGHEVIAVKAKSDDWAERLRTIFLAVTNAVEIWQPQEVAIENVFVNKNASSALKLGQARGAAIAAVAMRGLPLHEYSPREVKLGAASSGAADKLQVQRMVKLLLGASLIEGGGKFTKADAADALAIAICHAQRLRTLNRIHGSGPLRIALGD